MAVARDGHRQESQRQACRDQSGRIEAKKPLDHQEAHSGGREHARGHFAQGPSPQNRDSPASQKAQAEKDPRIHHGKQNSRERSGDRPHRGKTASLAEPHPPDFQDLASVCRAKRMMRETMEGMGAPRQAIDAPGGFARDPVHFWTGRTTTAVP